MEEGIVICDQEVLEDGRVVSPQGEVLPSPPAPLPQGNGRGGRVGVSCERLICSFDMSNGNDCAFLLWGRSPRDDGP